MNCDQLITYKTNFFDITINAKKVFLFDQFNGYCIITWDPKFFRYSNQHKESKNKNRLIAFTMSVFALYQQGVLGRARHYLSLICFCAFLFSHFWGIPGWFPFLLWKWSCGIDILILCRWTRFNWALRRRWARRRWWRCEIGRDMNIIIIHISKRII